MSANEEDLNTRLYGAESKSSGGYNAHNTSTNALGKYQHVWKWQKDRIKRVTGITNMQDYLGNKEAQEAVQKDLNRESFSAANRYGDRIREHIPNLGPIELAMINHFEPVTLQLLAQGKIGLDYVPGTAKYTNKTLGYYLYGDKWKGRKTGKGERNKYI